MKKTIPLIVVIALLLSSCGRNDRYAPAAHSLALVAPRAHQVFTNFTSTTYVRKERPMAEVKWLDGYTGQSVDELLALETEYRTDSLVLAFEQALQQKAERLGPDSLSDSERIILAVEALEREVNNGGYSQFFFNSSNEFTPIVVQALRAIGCPEAANLTQDAIAVLGLEGPITVDAVNRVMEDESEEREDKWEACDDRYFKEAGDLSDPLLQFIKVNKDKIRLKD